MSELKPLSNRPGSVVQDLCRPIADPRSEAASTANARDHISYGTLGDLTRGEVLRPEPYAQQIVATVSHELAFRPEREPSEKNVRRGLPEPANDDDIVPTI